MSLQRGVLFWMQDTRNNELDQAFQVRHQFWGNLRHHLGCLIQCDVKRLVHLFNRNGVGFETIGGYREGSIRPEKWTTGYRVLNWAWVEA